jgi:hypothetical protein
MTTEKLVNNALFGKTELKSVKVELGVVQDIDSVLKVANDLKKQSEPFGKELFDLSSRIRTVLSKMQEIEKSSANLENKSTELFNQFKKQAVELGLDINGSDAQKKYEQILSQLLTLPTYKEAKDIISGSIK